MDEEEDEPPRSYRLQPENSSTHHSHHSKSPSRSGKHKVPSRQVSNLNVPPGLEYLAGIDSLFVKQHIELVELLFGCETKNKYAIKDAYGRDIFTAQEESCCCARNCFGGIRPFDMIIRDYSGAEVLLLKRPMSCATCCCCPCWFHSLQVYSAVTRAYLGCIEQECTFCIPKFVLKNASGQVALRIRGPCCKSSCGVVEFKLLTSDGSIQVGRISKKWSGLAREFFTDAENFGINFPVDLDVNMKAVCIGACFLIDFMYFEKPGGCDS